MGNCLETCVQRRRRRCREDIENGQEGEAEFGVGDDKHNSSSNDNNVSNLTGEKSGMRIKIVLTKEELEWLLIQLEDDNDDEEDEEEDEDEGEGENKQRRLRRGRRQRLVLEDVLDEIERGRRIRKSSNLVIGWKPSLESIIEIPELVVVPDENER